jgi:hypothetical protein
MTPEEKRKLTWAEAVEHADRVREAAEQRRKETYEREAKEFAGDYERDVREFWKLAREEAIAIVRESLDQAAADLNRRQRQIAGLPVDYLVDECIEYYRGAVEYLESILRRLEEGNG